MKIGINCLRTDPNYRGGINSYTFGLIDGFSRVGSDYEFRIFVNPHNRHAFSKYNEYRNFNLIEIAESRHPIARRIYQSLPWQLRYRIPQNFLNHFLNWQSAEVLDRESDILYVPYGPSPLFPYPKKPTVYSIHDVQQIHFPDFFTKEQLLERKVSFGQCVRHATMIQASSRYMLEDFCEHFEALDENNVVVIPEGVDIDVFARPRNDRDIRQCYSLPPSFLFLPAQLWHHKNHITILKALKRLKDQGLNIPLVMTGAKYEAASTIFNYIESADLASSIFYLGVVPFDDIVALYQNARFLITAVLYESSSIPILEAAAAGTPIIAGRTPPNVELAENLGINLFNPTDDADLARVISAVWDQDEVTRQTVEENKVNILKYSWDNAAARYLDLFTRMMRKRAC